ncbi:hypothetical protein [Flavobacterium sp. UBA7680]|uniref:hypothetical protein n=1 Tax=Flavobacterium sp. UBA7680 TaxID=1946559 RepID=UPI0025C37BE5|nr:hypothetical protein [Flavobacterium sp. UBA7680]
MSADLVGDQNLNIAFQTVSGIRDAVSIATRKQFPPTYEQSLRFLYDLDEGLYNEFEKLLSEKNDSEIVRQYKEEAILSSGNGEQTDPVDLIDAEIERLKILTSKSSLEKKDLRATNAKIARLHAARESLKPRHLTENAILVRDFAQIDRREIFGEVLDNGYKYVDYEITENRFLRMRLLHPDKEEHITGADLIYEQYDIESEKVRFLFLQYKTWEDGRIYFSNGNLNEQLAKLRKTLCDCNFCEHPSSKEETFRMPHCCGFLRPTDKLQKHKNKMVSSGLHIPICKAIDLSKKDKKLDKKHLALTYPNHYIFEKLFKLGLVGSRWFDNNEIEKFYKDNKILEKGDTLKLYTTEYIKSKKKSDDELLEEDYLLS